MCGLTGILNPPGCDEVDRRTLRRMTDRLSHRGPDGDGFHEEAGIGLGHRRLAIIDIAGGHQPMYNEDESVVIVFNGEIYNFGELREALQAEGHVFRNRCDTEAIIHAWESWGPACLARLSGMFAFALWDRNQGVLFLARDRLGKKPLHYAQLPDGRLVFASELGVLEEAPGLPRRVDPCAVDDYFAYGYVPEPGTIWEGVRKLPAAHSMLVRREDLAHGRRLPAPTRYWDARAASEDQGPGEAEAVAELTGRLGRAVAMRLIADVPLGAFLSGGVDSSAVVAVAAGLKSSPLSTFTVGFPGEEDERPWAELVARRYGTDQHGESAAGVDYIAAAREQAAMFGEPFGDSSSVPTYRVCAMARRHVTVALSGDGGDEVFAGYRRYRWHCLAEAVRAHVPARLRREVIGRLARIYPKLDHAPRWLRAKHTLTEISLDSALGYFRTVCRVQHERRRALFSPALEAALDGYDPARRIPLLMEESGSEDPLFQAQYADLHTWLPGDILTKADRASMAASLEVRCPLLDYELVEWGLSLPADLKLRGGEGKSVLKRAMEPLLPRELLYRRKQGFATSLAGQFRAGAGRVRARLLGAPMLESGLFQPEALAQLVDEHESGRFDHATALWLLLVFEGFLSGAQAGRPAAPTPAEKVRA